MHKPQRIQLRRTKGWRMPGNCIKVCRPGPFGNPFTVEDALDAGSFNRYTAQRDAVWAFRVWLGLEPDAHHPLIQDGWPERKAELLRRLPELRGKHLACFCKPGDPCHADTLLALANA